MKNLRILAGIALMSSVFACQSIVDDLNVDPNNFTEISTELVLNHSVLNLASIQEAEPARIAGMWTDQFDGSDRQYITQDNYGVGDADFDAIWADLYRGGLAQARIAKAQAEAEGVQVFQGIAEITEGYYAAEAALLFGDVPFDQASDIDQFPDPMYEDQFKVIADAIALLDRGAGNTGTFSATTGNSVLSTSSTWAEFASALKARYLLARRDYSGALAAAQAAGFDDAASSVDIIHTTTNFSENLFYQFEAEQRTDYLTFDGSYLQRLLAPGDSINLADRADAKTDDSNRYNLYTFEAGGFIRLNTNEGGLFSASSNFPVIGYPEVQLIIAESALRLTTPDVDLAIASLNNARNFWDDVMGTDDYQDYVAADFADNDAILFAVLQEKFASVFGTPTFYDVIRTNNLIGTDLDGMDRPAQRFIYPSTERSSNSNYPGLLGIEVPTPINTP
ncbi:MAG: SusD/RagB family nutrient-binding outer membrane lipoprotein [Bacteroidota bacterium]